MQFYVDSLYNTTAPEELFYTDTICKAYFKSYVNWLIRRTNFYSGGLVLGRESIGTFTLPAHMQIVICSSGHPPWHFCRAQVYQ